MKTKRKKNPRRRHSTRRNPSSRRRRNPSTAGGLLGRGKGIVTQGFWALVGLVLARQIPQMLLGTRNTGGMGYAANAITAIGAGFAIQRFAGTEAGAAATIGGSLYVINRALQEHVSPVAKVLSLSGLGDPMALGEILTGPERTYFPLPVAYDNNRGAIAPDLIKQRPLPIAAAQPAGMGNYRRRVAM